MNCTSWVVRRPGEPMDIYQREVEAGPEEVLIEVAGCGICQTDLGVFFDGVPTRHPLPLTLGREVSGTVVETGPGAKEWMGKAVIVPAAIPCGGCDACGCGRTLVCPNQIFLGNDVHGGFGTHLRVPARGLCPVPELGDRQANPQALDLADLCLAAGGIATVYEAIIRSELCEEDLAIFVGVGSVGGFGVQIAHAFGATVIALDVSDERLEKTRSHGAALTLRSDEMSFKELKGNIRDLAGERGIPSWRHKIFETSGTVEGQATAFGLLGPGGFLSVVGFTPERIQLRLSKIMALDATIKGNWGCLPENYPAVRDLVLSGKVALSEFVERRPLRTINESFRDVRERSVLNRVILVPHQ